MQHRRILLVGLLFGFLGFIPIGMRLYNLMITQYERYSRLALRNQTRTTSVAANRGQIYDRNMDVLAGSQGVENLYLDPHELKQSGADLEAISQKLGQLLEKSPQWILEQGRDLTMRYKQIGANLDEQLAAQIRSYMNEAQIISGASASII